MNLTGYSAMKVSRGDKEMVLYIPYNTPFSDIHSSLLEMAGNIDLIAKQYLEEKEKEKKEEAEKKTEEVKPEVVK
jgi:hypothetical protein